MAICWERAVPLAIHLCCLYFKPVEEKVLTFWCQLYESNLKNQLNLVISGQIYYTDVHSIKKKRNDKSLIKLFLDIQISPRKKALFSRSLREQKFSNANGENSARFRVSSEYFFARTFRGVFSAKVNFPRTFALCEISRSYSTKTRSHFKKC